MTTAPAIPTANTQPPDNPSHDRVPRARISFRQPVSTTGFIDAAWWPRTRDLTLELPPLMDVLWTAGREINRITYHLPAWDPAPRRLLIEDRIVRLGGFTVGDPQTVTLSDPWGRDRVDILVIAPDTDPSVAQHIFDLAVRADDPYRAGEILERARGAAAHDSANRS